MMQRFFVIFYFFHKLQYCFVSYYVVCVIFAKIDPAAVHKRIFDAIKVIDDIAAIITPANRITPSKDIPSGVEYEQMFHDIRTNYITNRMYLSFTLESTHSISQLKCGSKHEGTTGIFDALRDNLAFIKLQNFHSLT